MTEVFKHLQALLAIGLQSFCVTSLLKVLQSVNASILSQVTAFAFSHLLSYGSFFFDESFDAKTRYLIVPSQLFFFTNMTFC